MKKTTLMLLLVSHLIAGGFGFGLGIYALPILIAPPAPTDEEISALATDAKFETTFIKDLRGSDAFHWGEGTVSISPAMVSFMGSLAPGPDYKLYLSPSFVEDEAEFNKVKASSLRLGDVKTFENFTVDVAPGVNFEAYNTVVVWCETFGEFISAGQYR